MGRFIPTPLSKQKSLWVKVDDDMHNGLPAAQLIRKLSGEKFKGVFHYQLEILMRTRKDSSLNLTE